MSVLVLSEECDPTADAVIESLQNRHDAEVYRVDLGWFPTRLDLDAVLGAAGWSGALRVGNREILLVGVRSIFYRRPTAFTFEPELTGPELRHARTEAKLGLGGCLSSLPLLWMNNPARQADMHKPVQLAAAKSVGLLVPRTLITNRGDAVRQFALENDGAIVIKPLGYASILEDGSRSALFTHVLTTDELADLSGVETTAHMFQRYIDDKVYELRLTVVGQGREAEFFPVAIHAGSSSAVVDFRADYPSLTYSVADLPGEVEHRVRAFMNRFGITLAHFDFCVDGDGRHWFLECNGAAGQYLFAEKATGLDITASIADYLQRGMS